MYFDSIRATFNAQEIKTKFDFVYLYQNALPDGLVSTIGRSGNNFSPAGAFKPYWVTEQNEQGVILYASNTSVKNMQIDGYFIYKGDDRREPIIAIGDNANIYTLGGKVTGNPLEHWKYSLEGAYQFGSKFDPTLLHDDRALAVTRDIDAFGVNSSVSYLFNDSFSNQTSLAFEYLSGDNPHTTGKDEMFDVLWGRWPRWSELYIYSYPNETSGKIAQWNNLLRLGPSWSLVPLKDTTFSATYNALFAPETTPTREMAAPLFNGGHFRGHYLQAVLKHKFNSHISAHLWSEFVWMGDYYKHEDLMTFLRAEVAFTF